MAIRLRREEGLSIRAIEQRLGVARSSVSVWVRDVELADHQVAAILARGESARSRARSVYFRARRRRFQEEGRDFARRGDPLHAAGCMLFWAEGSRRRNNAQLTNSDPAMLAFFSHFIRTFFDISDERIRVWCNLFADHAERQREVEDFWLATVGVPRSQLTKSTVNRYSSHSKKMRVNKLPYGTCRVTVHSTRVAQHLYGAIQEYAGFDRPEWLD